jgi:hypothetical protein
VGSHHRSGRWEGRAMDGDFDWNAPATLSLFVGSEKQEGSSLGFVPIKTGAVTDLVRFYSGCSDWVRQHSRLEVADIVRVDGYDIGDLEDRLFHAP